MKLRFLFFALMFSFSILSAGAQPNPSQVLVVQNSTSADSVRIASEYMRKRKIPPQNLITLTVPDKDTVNEIYLKKSIQDPIKAHIKAKKLKIDFIVLTRGMPYIIEGSAQNAFSLDSTLGMMDFTLLETRTQNPYFAKTTSFSHDKFGNYLVSRLDGYTLKDCLALIDRSLSARPLRGPFLMVSDNDKDKGGYKPWNDSTKRAHAVLIGKKMDAQMGNGFVFKGAEEPLMGYASWGSNDSHYKAEVYRKIKFLPGAIAETAVSSSGRTLRDPKQPGQSLIADLIAQGVTGCKGYVSEPYVDSISYPDIVFDRYTDGFSIVESLYMGSYYVNWKDVIIGDPLCAPYAKPTLAPKKAPKK